MKLLKQETGIERRPDDLKKTAFAGTLLSAGIALAWVILYLGSDIHLLIKIFLYNILIGFALSGSIFFIARAYRKTVPLLTTSLFLIGCLWVSPILLFNINDRVRDLMPDVRDLVIIPSVFLAVSLVAFILGHSIRRSGSITRSVLILIFSFIVPVFFLFTHFRISDRDTFVLDRMNSDIKMTPAQARVMVLGIDGASWGVIIPLIKEGKLPNLKRLMENGQYGILTSLDEVGSPVIWTSIFTGKLPENHGVTGWETSDSRNRFCKSLWNIVNDNGQKTITVNIPGTYPPEKVMGAMISGFPIPGLARSRTVYMEEYGKLYTNRTARNRILPSVTIELKPAEGWPALPQSFSPLIESQITFARNVIAISLAERLHLEHFFIELQDRRHLRPRQHTFSILPVLLCDTTDDGLVNYDTLAIYRDKQSVQPLAAMKKGEWSDWIRIDLESYASAAYFKARSIDLSGDHLDLYVTPLFQSSFDPIVQFTFPPAIVLEISKETGEYVVEGAGWKMHLDEVALDLLYEHIIDVASIHTHASEYLLKSIRDWKLFIQIFTESDRVQHAYWKYHEPEKFTAVDGKLVERHRGRINSVLEKIDADIGRFLTYLDDDTTIVVLSDHGFRADPQHDQGDHDKNGIIVLTGKNVRKPAGSLNLDMASFQKADVLSVTPTILALMGYPVARDMDGYPLLDLLDEAKLKENPLQFIGSYEREDHKKVGKKRTIGESSRDQLRSLGYIE